MKKKKPLWNGKYRPEDITPEYIQSLSMLDALNLCKWMNAYNSTKVKYNKGNGVSPVAFIFACPGQKEEIAGRVVAGATGKNLDRLLAVLSGSSNEQIKTLFPSTNRYDYLITNASEIIHYPALDDLSLPSKKEYAEEGNIKRLCEELSDIKYVFAFGQQAKDVSLLVDKELQRENLSPRPIFIRSLPHLSFLALNQIKEDVNGMDIVKGDPDATEKRLQVVANKIEREICSVL